VKLSDQQLIDCSDSYGNDGCNMGNPIYAYNYIKENGIAAGSSYPFKARELDSCNYNESEKKVSLIDYRYVPIRDNDFLRDLLYTVGPLVVGINASLFTFQSYKSGIYNDPNCVGGVNHALLLTGFGHDERYGDYWVLKNSYGKSWGENGYVRMSRAPNMCGIWELVVFPIVE
jgi:cathepsin L